MAATSTMDSTVCRAGEKWYTSELKAHCLVLRRTTLGVDTAMVWPECVAGKGFNETASALIGELVQVLHRGRAPVYSY